MYNELNKKCEKMIAEFNAIRPDLLDGPKVKGVREGVLLDDINAATNALSRVMNTIEAFYSED